MPPTIRNLSLQVTKKGKKVSADRGIAVGRSGSGKSTLQAAVVEEFADTYVRPNRTGWNKKKAGRILIIDTKPRWRATKAVTGHSLERYYRKQGYVAGDTVQDSVLLSNVNDWRLAFDEDTSSRIVIAQRSDLPDNLLVAWQVRNIAKFFDTQRPDEPSLLVIDEGMDFFGPSGSSRFGNAIQRCFRAGREKGMATLIGVQRPKCINLQCLTEANILYLFAINYAADVNRLTEMGWPKGKMPPQEDWNFWYMRDNRIHHKPLRLKERAA